MKMLEYDIPSELTEQKYDSRKDFFRVTRCSASTRYHLCY